MASVRFICGTQAIHKQLEDQLSAWLGTEDTILYPSCFDANGGLFETLLGAEDAVISDELNHASIIDGVRLCKAQRYRYKNADMADLEAQLQAADAAGARFKLIATDGVFSMDGYIAPLDRDLRPRRALRRAGPCRRQPRHRRGRRRRPRHARALRRDGPDRHHHRHARQGARRRQRRLHQRASKEIVELLRQRSRPYLFSNTVAPAMVAGAAQGGRAGRRGRRPARAAARQHALLPRGPDRGRLRPAPRRPSDHPGHAPRRPPRRPRSPRRCWRRASTSSPSPTRSCPRARRASAPRSPPPTPARSWSARSRRSPRRARKSERRRELAHDA